MTRTETVNANSGSKDPIERALSNFSEHSFNFFGDWFASVEGFIQGIKFPLEDPRREISFGLTGMEAKEMGNQAENNYVWFAGGERHPYGSKRHHEVIGMAIQAKFEQNPDTMEALLSTEEKKITHEVGLESPRTSLPKELFCKILTEIREKNKEDRKEYAFCSDVVKGGIKENGEKEDNYYQIVALVCSKCYGLTKIKEGATALPKCDHCGRQFVTVWV